MKKAEFSCARRGLVPRALLLVAVAAMAAGCSGGDYGSVPASPKATPVVAEAASTKGVPARKKAVPAPRVPRGPDQVKALQETTNK
jgi:hypothetical protein